MGDDLNLSITDTLDLDLVTKVTDAVVNLDLVLEELLEGGDVEDLIGGWLGSVDDVLRIDVSFCFNHRARRDYNCDTVCVQVCANCVLGFERIKKCNNIPW